MTEVLVIDICYIERNGRIAMYESTVIVEVEMAGVWWGESTPDKKLSANLRLHR